MHVSFVNRKPTYHSSNYKCYNCNATCSDEIIRFPIEYDHKTLQYKFSELPHCRYSCALRTVMEYGYNCFQYKMLFHKLYGRNIKVAPPRSVLYIEDGMDISNYHNLIDKEIIVEEIQNNTRSFIAPTTYNMAKTVDSMLTSGSLNDIDSFVMNETSIDNPRKHDDTDNFHNTLRKKLKVIHVT